MHAGTDPAVLPNQDAPSGLGNLRTTEKNPLDIRLDKIIIH